MPDLDPIDLMSASTRFLTRPGGVVLYVGAIERALLLARNDDRVSWLLPEDDGLEDGLSHRLLAVGLADRVSVVDLVDVLDATGPEAGGSVVTVVWLVGPGSPAAVLDDLAVLIERNRPAVVVDCADSSDFLAVDGRLGGLGYRYVTRFTDDVHLFLPSRVKADRPIERAGRRRSVVELLGEGQPFPTERVIDLLRRDVEAAEMDRCAADDELLRLQVSLDEMHERLLSERFRHHETITRLQHERAQGESALAESRMLNRLLSDANNQRVAEQARAVPDTGNLERDAQLAGLQQELVVANGLIGRLRTSARDSSMREQELKTKLANARSALARFESRLQDARAATAAANARVGALKASATYRIGALVRDTMRSPSRMIGAPKELKQIAAAWREQQVDNDMAPTPDAMPSVEVLAVPSSDYTGPTIKPKLARGHHKTAALQRDRSFHFSSLRVAAIMDDFTARSFSPECEITHLLPETYLEQLEASRPQFLFLESAWRGKDDAWGSRVAHTSSEVRDIIRWCRDRGIPTMLWNKEDPVHYTTFLNTAKLVDVVYTTDFDCIQSYKADLGHDCVYLLPFASQPTMHNPLAMYDRENAFSFAGAYYKRYPERTRDLESFIEHLPESRPFRIYDRNLGKADASYQFPAVYAPYIVGTLTGDEIDMAYKGFTHAINLNSVKESQTMFARRVFELLASNTLTVSNYARGLSVLFGELTVHADSGRVLADQLSQLDDDQQAQIRLTALRKVMTEHTYADRMAYVVRTLGIDSTRDQPVFNPRIHVFSLVSSEDELRSVQTAVNRQAGVTVVAHIFSRGGALATLDAAADDISTAKGVPVSDYLGDDDAVAYFSPVDHHGPHYLLDLALARRYSTAAAVGKPSPFYVREGELHRPQDRCDYTAVSRLPMRSSLVLDRPTLASDTRAWLIRAESGGQLSGSRLLAADPYNYCRDGVDHAEVTMVDSAPMGIGASWTDLTAHAESVRAAVENDETTRSLAGRLLADMFPVQTRPSIKTEVDGDEWSFRSSLEDGKHDYLYAAALIPVSDITATDGSLRFFLETTPGLNLQLALIVLDSAGKRIDSAVRAANQNQIVSLTSQAATIRLGVRVHNQGAGSIKRLVWGHRNLMPSAILGEQGILIVTNAYPSYSDLYRNGFVHTRARGYQQAGKQVEVFVLSPNAPIGFREYAGVSVTSGGIEVLETMLRVSTFEHVMVHFLNRDMWNVLKPVQDSLPISIWVHGSDVQPWTRRPFLYTDDTAREKARVLSQHKLAFWNEVMDEAAVSTTFVFVSQWLADTALEDLQRDGASATTTVVHNPIDVDRFSYQKKKPEQRLRILSIRPYASAVYANDLTVEAIRLLSREPFFDHLHFTLVGAGPLFQSVTAPLRGFTNVVLDERFLTPAEIKQAHDEHGIFLCPSRMDTQGVSRDEAMASGLVPVVSDVGAVSQFVDEKCGLLSEAEDATHLASSIALLARDPELFLRLSQGAAERVRGQSSHHIVIPKELNLINSGKH